MQERNSSRGRDLQCRSMSIALREHLSCYEARGRHELGLSGQGGENGSAFSLKTYDI